MAIYQFTSASKNLDISPYRNPPAKFSGVYYSRGPDNHRQGALSFRGTRNSYVLIPNNGCLDMRYSMTIIFWVYPETPGALVHFNPKGRGVDVGIARPCRLYARFWERSGKYKKELFKGIMHRQWNYVAVTYDHSTGFATLWSNSVSIIRRRIGSFPLGLATNYEILMGREPGDRRRFRGKVSCLQIYNYPMTSMQIRSKMKWCFREGTYSQLFQILGF